MASSMLYDEGMTTTTVTMKQQAFSLLGKLQAEVADAREQVECWLAELEQRHEESDSVRERAELDDEMTAINRVRDALWRMSR